MPELPEVETVRLGLQRYVVGKTIESVEVVMEKLLKPPIIDPDEFQSLLRSKRILNTRRRGKYLIFELDSGYALVAHLKMRGSFRFIESAQNPDERHIGLRIKFTDGTELRYHDMWGWGEFRVLVDNQESIFEAIPALSDMGMEPFDAGFSAEALRKAALRRARTSIKACLLDQTVLAGVGNIYADESLHRAGIRPDRVVADLSDEEWQRLRDAIVTVLEQAVGGGGTVSDNFADSDGRPGAFVPVVYGRGGQACVTCGIPLKRIKISGRGTVFCPNCQQTGRGQV